MSVNLDWTDTSTNHLSVSGLEVDDIFHNTALLKDVGVFRRRETVVFRAGGEIGAGRRAVSSFGEHGLGSHQAEAERGTSSFLLHGDMLE